VTVVFYITGHGFGHAVRQIAIINALAQRRPDATILVRTAVSPTLLARSLRRSVRVHPVRVDTGAIQVGSLDVHVEATLKEATAFYEAAETWIAGEAAFLAEHRARLVVADIPPLPLAAAGRQGVPAIGISNFTWDWIYGGYDEARSEAPRLVEQLAGYYAEATEGWRLPMHGGFESFDRLRDLPLVARLARQSREEVRTRLGLPTDERLVLISLGGYGASGVDIHAAARDLRGLAHVVATSHDQFAPGDGLHRVDEDAMYGSRIRYEDLVAAVDVVASKPGYGIISECAANRTALMYTSRGRFREYDVLVAAMPGLLNAGYLPLDDFRAGRWADAVRQILAQPRPPRPPSHGARVAAEWLSERLDAAPAPAR
jgi:L-arabinokinase